MILITGDKDYLAVSPEMPLDKIKIISNAGHYVFIEKPKEFSEIIKIFLK